jgi:hypothetical protein
VSVCMCVCTISRSVTLKVQVCMVLVAILYSRRIQVSSVRYLGIQ